MDSLEEIFAAYSNDIYRYLYSLCRDASLAEDLTSEVFLEAVKSLGSFRAESSIRTWLFTIARRRLSRYLSKKHRQMEQLTLSELENVPAPDSDRISHELAARISALIAEESERVQTVMRLRLSGYSFCEIGSAAGISERSARVLYHRTKEKIRKKLKEEGYTYE